jgi:hypothetical protein
MTRSSAPIAVHGSTSSSRQPRSVSLADSIVGAVGTARGYMSSFGRPTGRRVREAAAVELKLDRSLSLSKGRPLPSSKIAIMLRADLAPRIVPVVLANITRRYPYHDARLFRDGDPPFDPFAAHPAFGNSFDWHSSVHSHWTALQLLSFADASTSDIAGCSAALSAAVIANLSATNIDAEAAYISEQPTYERPYGWAWLLRLVASAEASKCLAASREALRRFARHVADRAIAWLGSMPGPVRHGVHGNTAFAMGLMLDASRALGFVDFEEAIVKRATQWFRQDRDYPAGWERSAHDFLSPGLTVADLMRRMLADEDLIVWWRAFAPGLEQVRALAAVADVPDVSDGQIVHLHGLNLSRAGVLARLAAVGGEFARLLVDARSLFDASVRGAYGDEYLSTHWLPTFAWDAAASIDAAEQSEP